MTRERRASGRVGDSRQPARRRKRTGNRAQGPVRATTRGRLAGGKSIITSHKHAPICAGKGKAVTNGWLWGPREPKGGSQGPRSKQSIIPQTNTGARGLLRQRVHDNNMCKVASSLCGTDLLGANGTGRAGKGKRRPWKRPQQARGRPLGTNQGHFRPFCISSTYISSNHTHNYSSRRRHGRSSSAGRSRGEAVVGVGKAGATGADCRRPGKWGGSGWLDG